MNDISTATAAAAAVLGWRSAIALRISIVLCAAKLPLCWTVLVLAAAARPRFDSPSWDPILLLSASAPSLLIGFVVALGDIGRQPSRQSLRWAMIACLALPAILLVPFGLAGLIRLPLVHPRPQEGAVATAGAAMILFAKPVSVCRITRRTGLGMRAASQVTGAGVGAYGKPAGLASLGSMVCSAR